MEKYKIDIAAVQEIRWGGGGVLDKSKVKVKFTLEHATKAQRGSRSIALLFL
jgi:hypothetical protein